MEQYVKKYTYTELMDSVYQTTSQTEYLLKQLIDLLNDGLVEEVLNKSFSSLFENEHFLHASIPISILKDCENALLAIDHQIIDSCKTIINHLAILMALLQCFDQIQYTVESIHNTTEKKSYFTLKCNL